MTGNRKVAASAFYLLYYPKWNYKTLVRNYAVCNYSNNDNERYTTKTLELDAKEQMLHFEKMAQSRRSFIRKEIGLAALQMFLVPQISCSTAVRAGAVGDGGKWVCNPWRVGRGCVVYSFGVNGDTSFESEMFELTKKRCKIYSFDIGPQKRELFDSFDGSFNQWRISAVTNRTNSEWSIVDIAGHYSHDRIDFMKMDIEGGEFSSLPPFLNSEFASEGKICQIFIELHSYVNEWKNLLDQLEKAGFLMFYKEVNTFCPSCFEYSYIHESCLTNYGVTNLVFNKNFQ